MTARGYSNGHQIYYDGEHWRYVDGDELANGNGYYTGGPNRQKGLCAHCKRPPTPEGYDGCLGELPKSVVMNACCGHGNSSRAYVQFWWDNDDCDARISGYRAEQYIEANRGTPTEVVVL